MSVRSWLRNNSLWLWNRYTKELTLKWPASGFAIFIGFCAVVSIIAGLLEQFIK